MAQRERIKNQERLKKREEEARKEKKIWDKNG